MKVKNEKLMQQNFMEYIQLDSTKVLSITLGFDTNNKPDSTGWAMYRPESWEVATGISGYSILMAHPDIGFFSLGFFTLGIVPWHVPLTSEPSNCLSNITEEDFTKSITNLLSSGLKSNEDQNKTELPNETLICRELANVSGNIVKFEFLCCDGNGYCPNNEPDFWQKALFYSVMVLGIITFLYVSNLVPEYLYRDKTGYKIFYLDLEACAEFKVIDNSADRVAVDAKLETETLHGKKKNSICMSSLSELEKGDTYSVKGLWLRVPNVRLVSKSYLPIGLFIFLYQRLIRCTCNTYRGHATPSLRMWQISTLYQEHEDGKSMEKENNDFTVGICCDLPICNPDPDNRLIRVRLPSWNMILQIFTAVLSSTIFAIPWILIYALDDDLLEGKRGNYAWEKGLIYHPPPYAFNLLRFVKSTVPGLSIASMIIYVICIIIVCVILTYDRTEREYVGKRLRSTLRDAKDRWDKGVINSSKLYVILLLPFKCLRNYGILALLLWPLWIVITCPPFIFFAILGNTPTVNIFLRLLILFVKDIIRIFRTEQMRRNTLSSVERCILYGSFICVLIIVHFLTFALVLLFVNAIGYTLAGVIVTANDTFRYTSFSLLIILNAYDVFLNVEKRYQIFNEKIQAAILEKTRERIKKIAKCKAEYQPHVALKIQTETAVDEDEQQLDFLWENIAISDKNKILFNARSVVQFLDKDDEVFLSEKFFFEACYMDYYGCPGDFPSSLLDAARRVMIIIMFLVFVLFTLNAFGGLAVFTASGLLITLSWGLLPLLINRFFTKPIPELSLDTEDFNFQNKLDSLIYEFSEYWEVVDLDVEKLEDVKTEVNGRKRSKFWLRLNDENAVQISVPVTGHIEPCANPEPEKDAQLFNEAKSGKQVKSNCHRRHAIRIKL